MQIIFDMKNKEKSLDELIQDSLIAMVNNDSDSANQVFTESIAALEIKNESRKIENHINQLSKTKGYQFNVSVEPRLYFQLKEHIANGESANNLSGNFFALNLGYTNTEKTKTDKILHIQLDNQKFVNAAFVFGTQMRLLNHLFLENKVGLGARTRDNLNFTYWKGFGMFDMKLGLCF